MLVQALKNISDRKYSSLNWLEFSLIILSSVLLGIWTAANTIALRNILLVLGTLLSIAYFYQLHHQNQLKQYFGLRNSIPLFCIIGLFLWVLAHCFLFPTDYPAQINELQSTWLRSSLAVVVGVATGIAIARNPAKIYWLWIGMTLCFLYLLGQYLIDVWYTHKLFTERYMQYIFLGKVNGVLVGSILVSGILGTSLSPVYEYSKYKIALGVIGIFIITLVLYSYLYILEARNGFIAILVMFAAWSIIEFKKITQESKSSNSPLFNRILIISLLVSVVLFALIKHIERTPQWLNLAEDIAISSQIDQYLTWQHAEEMGPPQGASGRYISANTYLRVAWFVAGVKLIPENLLGHGVLHESFQRAIDNSSYLGAKVKSTHSAWLDFFLSFGFPGIFIVFLSLIQNIIAPIQSNGNFKALNVMLMFNVVVVFLISELTRQHCIEMLVYLICLCEFLNLNEIQK